MPTVNYRTYAADLLKGVRWAAAHYGSRLVGGLSLLSDLVAEGSRQAFISGLPNHPECLEDSVDQCGTERGVIRYRGDTLTSLRARVFRAFDDHEQSGSAVLLKDLADEYLSILKTFLGEGSGIGGTAVTENFGGTFQRIRITLNVNDEPTAWGVAPTFGGGYTYGQTNVLYGIVATFQDIQELRALLRRFKRAASHVEVLTSSGAIIQV